MINIFKIPLWQQILIGLVLGIIVGVVLGEKAIYIKPLGSLFLGLIKMVIIPLVLFSLLSALISIQDDKNITLIGMKAVGLYILSSLIAVIIGISVASLFKPGAGVNLNLVAPIIKPVDNFSIWDNVIPDNILKSMADANLLQVVIFAIFLGLIINKFAKDIPNTVNLIKEFSTIFFRFIEIIVKFAPFGVFGYIGWTVGTQGFDILLSLLKFVGVVIFALMLLFSSYAGLIYIFAGIKPWPFYKKMIEPQILAFSTTSSKAALTTTMRVLHDKIGVSKETTNFILPFGASVNMDGTAVYLTICGIFFAQYYGIDLTFGQYIILAFASTVASIGAAGIPSGSIVFMGMVLSSIGMPIEGVGLIIGVDRILDMFRTTVNITGDAAITLIIDKSENKLNLDKYYE